MQEVFCVARTCERPIVFVSPLVRSHDEKLYPLRMGKFVGHVFEEKVVPAQCNLIFIERSVLPEIYFADLTLGAGVPADRDQEMLSAARGFVLSMQLHSSVVA